MLPHDLSLLLAIGFIATAGVVVYCHKKRNADQATQTEGSYAYDQTIYVDDPEPVPASPTPDF